MATKPIKHNASAYTSQRGLAAICQTTPQTIARAARQLNLGTPGKYANSPRVFTKEEGVRVAEAVFNERNGEALNKIVHTKAEIVKTARHMARLAPLAAAMGHSAAGALNELANIAGRIDGNPNMGDIAARIRSQHPSAAGKLRELGKTRNGGNFDLTTIEGKTRFLNSVNPHFNALLKAVQTVSASL